jgi:hypothetical protein
MTNGHGRYITVTPERALVSVGKFPLNIIYPLNFRPLHFRNRLVTAVSFLKPPFSGFRSKTAIWIQKRILKSVRTSRKL